MTTIHTDHRCTQCSEELCLSCEKCRGEGEHECPDCEGRYDLEWIEDRHLGHGDWSCEGRSGVCPYCDRGVVKCGDCGGVKTTTWTCPNGCD